MVSLKPDDRIDKAQAEAIEQLLPTRMDEMPQLLRVIADWREADLRSCRGALAQLQAFPAQKGGSFWHHFLRHLWLL